MDKIGKFTTTELNISIDVSHIVTLHYFKYSKDFTFSGEKHDFWEIAYVDKGEIGVVAESQGFDLYQGEAIFHKPNEYHNIWAKNQFANVVILSFVSHSRAMSFFENKIITFNEKESDLLAKILAIGEVCFKDPLDDVHQTKLNLTKDSPFASQQTLKNYIELLLISLIQSNTDFLRRDRASDSTKRQGDSNIVEAIQQLLAENVYGTIYLQDVLQKTCFSKSYLTRLFREQTGYSIMEYYTNLKIGEAKKLISERELSFSEIAERLELGTIHYFSYLFKKKTNMTPSEYHKSVQSRAVL